MFSTLDQSWPCFAFEVLDAMWSTGSQSTQLPWSGTMHLVCLMEVDSRQPEHRTFITKPLQFSRHINRQWKSDHRRQHFSAYLDCIQLTISLCYILLYLSLYGSGYLLLHIPQGDWTTYKYYLHVQTRHEPCPLLSSFTICSPSQVSTLATFKCMV